MKKKVLISVGIVVAVAVIGVIVLAANLGRIVNSRKDALLARAEMRIGRDISVGDVGVALWPELGVRVRDASVSEDPAFGTDPCVRVADLRVNVALMPLLKRRVEVKRFVLNQPVITVIKAENKRFNFTSLVERASTGAAAKPGTSAGTPPSGAAAAVPFVLAVAGIENGTVRYIDRATAMDRTIRDIDLSAQNVRLDSKITATLAAAVFGEAQDVRLETTVGPVGEIKAPSDLASKPLTATLAMGPVKLSTLAALKAGAKPVEPGQDGDARLDATLSGTFGAAVFDAIAVRLALLGAAQPNVEISASAGPFNLLADSTAVFTGARLKGSSKAGPIGLAGVRMKPAAPGQPIPVLGGEVNATASFEGEATALAFTSRIDATQASYAVPEQLAKPAGIPAVVEVRGVFRPQGVENEGLEFTSIEATVHALRAKGSGRLVPFPGREAMRFSLEATTSLAPWKDLMPALAPLSPGGEATAKIEIAGTPKPGVERDIRGTATLSNVSATLPNVPHPLQNGKGTASFTMKSARIDAASFTIGKSAFRARADIPSFAPMTATYTVTSDEVWRADVQAPVPNAPRLPRPEVFRTVNVIGKSNEIAGAARAAAGAPKPLQSDLEITSQSGIASNIDYTDATASVRATPEKVFIDRFSAKTMQGTINGSGTFEPAASKFALTTKVENVNLTEYFRFKWPPLADALAGRISGDLSLSGAGNTWEELQRTLAGKGGAVVVEGALLNVNVTKQLFSSIQGLSVDGIPVLPVDLTTKMAARNPKLFETNTTVFKNLTGNITIADGKLQVPDLALASADVSLAGAGWISFGKDVNLSTTFTLSDKLSSDLVAQVPAVKYLVASSGRLEVPLTLSGTVLEPKIVVDTAALSARLRQSLAKEGREGLNQQIRGLLDGLKKKE